MSEGPPTLEGWLPGEDQGRRDVPEGEGRARHLTEADAGPLHGVPEQLPEGDDPIPVIKVETGEYLVGQVPEPGLQPLPGGCRVL